MSCYEYWAKISTIADALRVYDSNDIKRKALDEIVPLLDAIEIIAHDTTIEFEEAHHILDNERMNDALKTIREFYVAIGERLEKQNAYEILDAGEPRIALESFHYYKRYPILVGNEVRLAGFSAGDRVVFIGGGPLPLTSMLLNTCYGIEGISVEIVPQVAALSRRVLDKLGCSAIEVVCGDESALADLKHNGVIIAALAEPKKRIFRIVQNLVASDTKVLYRTYSGMRAILYAPVVSKDLTGFQEVGRVLPTGKVNNTSVLIKKELE
jgi:protein-L-isoaspartate O-methyltransferase